MVVVIELMIHIIQKGEADTPDVTPVYDDDKDTQILLMLLLSMKMKHMSLKHGIPGTAVCEVCAAIFETKNILGIHMSLEHNQKTNLFAK